MLKDFVRALSLANLCFIAAWSELLDPLYNIPGFNQYVSIIINVFSLALLFWTAITLARRFRKPLALRVAHLVFPLVLLLPLNGVVRILLPNKLPAVDLAVTALAIATISLSDVKPWDSAINRGAATLTLVLFPFFFITMGRAVWSLTEFTDRAPAPPASARKTSEPRVLWFLFDEMDYQIAFSKRPVTLQLPELDRFRSQALFATNAYPPAEYTLNAMPALITGRPVYKTELISPSRIMITFADSRERVNWGSQPNLFSRARESGFDSAVIGWYLPYCDAIGESLSECSWENSEPTTLRQGTLSEIQTLAETIPLVSTLVNRFGVKQKQQRKRQLEAYLGVLSRGKEAAINPNLGLILVHLPLPHPPNIYDRRLDEFELGGNRSYLDSLSLADRALGELRRAIESAGMWDDAIVLVTSDHWWRTEIWRSTSMWSSEDEETMAAAGTDHRVPFMVKLRGQRKGVTYNTEFNSILTHDLLLGILKGETTSPQDVMNWLDGRRSVDRSPSTTDGSK